MYRAPVSDIAHTLKHTVGFATALEDGRFGEEMSDDLVDAILDEAARFANEEMVPIGWHGDRDGVTLKDGEATTAEGWADLYRRWTEGGWNAITGPEEFGGQGLPLSLGLAVSEMWNSASIGFSLCPTLTMGAVEALEAHGSEELKATYLEKLVSGEWTGTMNLTEPQAGSDLAALKAKAESVGDGTYRIFGQKIYITFGEHDFTDNIVHLVLARLPDAPAGTRGISLFLVPKFIPKEDGTPGARNDVICHSVEHKLGIHGSPTCTMIYGDGKFGDEPGAIGWLIGEENRGLNCMFTMMNNARLLVGLQGVAVAEAAFQKALEYAQERRQGKAAGWKGEGMAPIVYHPDVQRDLLTMKAMTAAARAICYACGFAIDMSHDPHGVSARGAASGAEGQADETGKWSARANLLTPIAKAFSTDIGVDVANTGIQVHGGMGYVEETGAARLLRDARIAPIYEGTNGIQAIDLVMRKLPLADGRAVHDYIADLRRMADEVAQSNAEAFGRTGERLARALEDLTESTEWLQERLQAGEAETALAGATPYLRQFGLTAGGCYLARGAGNGDDEARTALARFFAENLLGETSTLKDRVMAGADSLEAAAERALVVA
ncbi:acyl-CoA dehydrogenase [Notoacmeibacter marinus]|uniref:3-methylmercaptopropionyl-CoA dehydrogenase n=1 Tax=Notoacmeibacter marinus TaxID=1876515 RepID=A0A231UUJ6_9HYPH|nr:acyl-CoA dehydrogenase family protein [Notoacmeibacter marinus]OXS99556.1 acyl-CoA dehydrogenase [Notoacmeibacter marinus]